MLFRSSPLNFKPLVSLYRQKWAEFGHQPEDQFISVHSHGYIAEDAQQAVDDYYPSMEVAMNRIGRERGWTRYTRATYDAMRSAHGALYVGNPQQVADKIVLLHKHLGIDRFALHVPVGPLDHDKVMKTIELLGTKVRPLVDAALAQEEKN